MVQAASPGAPVASHVGADAVPWVDNPSYPGTRFRLVQADIGAGVYAMEGEMAPGLAVGTHRHLGAVHMLTFSGSWGYREHDYLNTAGSYLYEPPGSVHTLYVPGDNTEPTRTWTIVYGRTEYLDSDGEVIAVTDTATMLRSYLQACEAAGLPRPEGLLT